MTFLLFRTLTSFVSSCEVPKFAFETSCQLLWGLQGTLLPPTVPHPPWEALPPAATWSPRGRENLQHFHQRTHERRFHSDHITNNCSLEVCSGFAKQIKHLNDNINIHQPSRLGIDISFSDHIHHFQCFLYRQPSAQKKPSAKNQSSEQIH